ncbi:MAG: phosphonate metabolism transcriptional regulator PhnF [Burkholderiaceae bacterium]
MSSSLPDADLADELAPARWIRIAQVLAAELADGRPPPGARLPSEQALADRFGVNRHTLRRATRLLADQGYVQIRAGAGLFARSLVLDYALHRSTRLSQNLAENGEKAVRELLDAPIEAAGRRGRPLRLSASTRVQVLATRSLVRDKPIALSRAAFPLPRFADLPDRFERLRSIAEVMNSYGVSDYHRAHSKISCRLPTDDEADRLMRPAGMPVLIVEYLNVDADSVPLEAGTTVFAADSIQLTVAHE